MKPISDLTKDKINDIKLVCFDVDGVTVEKGTVVKEEESEKLKTLIVKTKLLSDEMRDVLLELKDCFYIAINSGRSTIYLKDLFNDLLWDNFALIGEIGIYTLAKGELVQHEKFDNKTLEKMRKIRLELEKYIGRTKAREAFEPKQFLITLHMPFEDKQVYELVEKVDSEGEFAVIWSGEAFDILPKRLNKGTALKNLCKYLDIDVSQTLAIGNGNNDRDMTDTAGVGVTTEPNVLKSDFFTAGNQHLGGLELARRLLELKKNG
jgi:HAD superfamily hydrolase (TIGR01484 family)